MKTPLALDFSFSFFCYSMTRYRYTDCYAGGALHPHTPGDGWLASGRKQ